MSKPASISVDGVKYVREDSIATNKPSSKGAVIVRTESAGVHYGVVSSRKGNEVKLLNSRRLWYWKGAASLSQLAVDGVTHPNECKFSVRVAEITVLGAIEIIPCTDKAIDCIEGVKEWKQ